MISRALAAGRRAFQLAALFTFGASVSYFGWHVVFELISPSINAGIETSSLKWSIVVAGLSVLFIAQSLMQANPNGRFANWLHVHLVSGLYIDDWFTRVTFRLWPPGYR
jgi:NAD(P)H-quinone oxidoreductase subunit 5